MTGLNKNNVHLMTLFELKTAKTTSEIITHGQIIQLHKFSFLKSNVSDEPCEKTVSKTLLPMTLCLFLCIEV